MTDNKPDNFPGARTCIECGELVGQDLVDTHHGASEWAELLARALAGILADPTIYKAEQVK